VLVRPFTPPPPPPTRRTATAVTPAGHVHDPDAVNGTVTYETGVGTDIERVSGNNATQRASVSNT
jgi:hypothetical protein